MRHDRSTCYDDRVILPGNYFAGSHVDRRAQARDEADWAANARADSGTRYVAMRGSATLVAVPRESIKPPIVEPSFAIVMKSSPGWPSSNSPTVR